MGHSVVVAHAVFLMCHWRYQLNYVFVVAILVISAIQAIAHYPTTMPRGARGAASRARHSAARAKIYNDKIKSPQHKTFDKEPKVPDKPIQHFIYTGNSRMTDAVETKLEQKFELGGFLSEDSEVRKEVKDNVKSVVSLRWADMVDDDESLSDDDMPPDVDRALADLYLY